MLHCWHACPVQSFHSDCIENWWQKQVYTTGRAGAAVNCPLAKHRFQSWMQCNRKGGMYCAHTFCCFSLFDAKLEFLSGSGQKEAGISFFMEEKCCPDTPKYLRFILPGVRGMDLRPTTVPYACPDPEHTITADPGFYDGFWCFYLLGSELVSPGLTWCYMLFPKGIYRPRRQMSEMFRPGLTFAWFFLP